jgi:hypothetical protein
MFSLEFLLAQLYPNKKPEEVQLWLSRLDTLPSFDARSWQKIKKADLENEEVKLRLVKTLFNLSIAYDGVGSEIAKSIEKWSEDATLIFLDFSADNQDFYEHYYAFLGWVLFSNMKLTTQIYLLGSRFLLMACIWQTPIYNNVQNFFAGLISLRVMENNAIIFKEAMETNDTILKEEGKNEKTIAQWIESFVEFDEVSLDNKVDEYLASSMEVSRLSEKNKSYLGSIFTLYWGLRTGLIYTELDFSIAPGIEHLEKRENKNTDDYYLQMLYKATAEDFSVWLESHEDAVDWIAKTQKPIEFIKKLLFILLEKVDMKNEKQIENTISFINSLNLAGLEGLDDVIYFDEEKTEFKWNEDFFVWLNKK